MVYDAQGMTRVAFDMRTTNLATNTTLGTATRHDFSAKTCYIPELTRSFSPADGGRVMVKVVAYFNDATIRDLDGIRIGIKIGAVAFDDLDFTIGLNNTGNNYHVEQWRDVTSYFVTNNPSAATFQVQVGVAFATAVAANMIDVGAELFVTYGFDSSASTLGRTAVFPIQGHHTTVATGGSFTEIGTTGGTANAPANQIRKLTGSGGAFENVTGFTKRQRYLIITGMNVTSGTTTVQVRVDGGAATNYNLSQVSQTAIKVIIYYDITALSDSAAHSLEIGTNTTGMEHASALDVVVYEQSAASTTNFVSIMVPLTLDGGDHTGLPYRLGSSTDADRLTAAFDVPEPSPVIDQCGVVYIDQLFSSGWDTLTAASGQTTRTYDRGTAANRDAPCTLVHRTDHSSSTWAVVRGQNKLYIDVWQTQAGNTITSITGYAIINYRCGLHADGNHRHNRTVLAAQVLSYVEGYNSTQTPDEPAIPASRYRLSGAILQATQWHLVSGNHTCWGAQRQNGEDSGKGWYRTALLLSNGIQEIGSDELVMPANWWRTDDNSGVGGNVEAERKWNVGVITLNNGHQANLWLTYHSCTFTVAGVVTIGGAAATDGKTVNVFAQQGLGLPAAFVGSALTGGGTGAFSVEVLDNTKTYFVTYDNDGYSGKSANGTPESSTFNVTIVTAFYPDVILTSHPQVESASSTAVFAFTIATGSAEFSHNGSPYSPASSPLTLSGLSNGLHRLTIRSTTVGGALQSFTWVVNAEPVLPEPIVVSAVPSEYEIIDHAQAALDRLPAFARGDEDDEE